VRIKVWPLLSLLVLATSVAYCSEISAEESKAKSRAVTTTELAAWLTSGVPSPRLARMVTELGLATLPTHDELKQLQLAGAEKELMSAAGSGFAFSAEIGPGIPDELLKAAKQAREQHFHEAENELRGVLSRDQGNPALHLALAVMLRQQDQFDDAYQELALALRLMPDLPENHNAMSYLFYRLDDGPNAIAEARTALSIDPKNAEA